MARAAASRTSGWIRHEHWGGGGSQPGVGRCVDVWLICGKGVRRSSRTTKLGAEPLYQGPAAFGKAGTGVLVRRLDPVLLNISNNSRCATGTNDRVSTQGKRWHRWDVRGQGASSPDGDMEMEVLVTNARNGPFEPAPLSLKATATATRQRQAWRVSACLVTTAQNPRCLNHHQSQHVSPLGLSVNERPTPSSTTSRLAILM